MDQDSTPNNTTPSEDDQDEVVVTPRQLVDVSVTKTADTNTPNIGGNISFTVTVTNDGPSDATTVVVTDLLASGYEFVSAIPSVGTYEPIEIGEHSSNLGIICRLFVDPLADFRSSADLVIPKRN